MTSSLRWHYWFRRWRRIERFLLPPRCVCCGVATRVSERALCAPCRQDLPRNTPCCSRCAAAVPELATGTVCAVCLERPPPWFRAIAPLGYEFPVSAALRALKFHRRLECAPAFAPLMLAAYRRAALDCDAVVAVPLHAARHASRGFNQALELARPIARTLRLPILSGISRVRRTQPQSGLDASARRQNVERAFRVARPARAAHVLIVDDVMTTGATVAELAVCLRRAGVARVSVLAAARRSTAVASGAAGRKRVVQDNAQKHDQPDQVVLEERLEAAFPVAPAGKPQVPGHQQRRQQE